MRLLLLVLLTTAAAFAQANPSVETSRVNYLAGALTLTVTQQTQAMTIFGDAGVASTPLHEGIRTAQMSLREAVRKNDLATIDMQAARVGRLSGQLTVVEAKADAAFFTILTPDQRTRYIAIQDGAGRGGFAAPAGFGRR